MMNKARSSAINAAARPIIEPQAIALVEASAQAYRQLQGLSMRFSNVVQFKDEVQEASGTIAWSWPGRARVEITSGGTGETRFFVADGTRVWQQTGPRKFQRFRTSILGEKEVVRMVLNRMNLSLPDLSAWALGETPHPKKATGWDKVVLLAPPRCGVLRTVLASPLRWEMERLDFDPGDHLLRSFESESYHDEMELKSATKFTDIHINPAWASDAFAFTPPENSKIQSLDALFWLIKLFRRTFS